MKIQTTGTYRGLDINDTSKGFKGYYIQHLEGIYSLLVEAKLNLVNPLVAHFVIDNPTPRAINSLNQELNRWKDQRLTSSESIRYYACLETRPKNKQKHIHVLVIFTKPAKDDRFLSTSLNLLAERLRKLSDTDKAKLCKRKSSAKKTIIDQDTGEIKTNKDGLIIRLGSSYYHNLITEFGDAFKRLSYFAKVHTKDQEQIRGLNYSSSRIPRLKTINNTKENKINASNTRIIDLLEQETSLSVCDSHKDSKNQEQPTRAVTFRSCQSPRVHIRRKSRHSKLFQSQENYCCFTKGSKDSKNYKLSIRI